MANDQGRMVACWARIATAAAGRPPGVSCRRPSWPNRSGRRSCPPTRPTPCRRWSPGCGPSCAGSAWTRSSSPIRLATGWPCGRTRWMRWPSRPSRSGASELRALLTADPMAERPWALLMRALYAAGRQAEALGVYADARALLAGQLGVDPSAQLEQVYLRILRGQEMVPVAVPDPARDTDRPLSAERAVVPAPVTSAHPAARSVLTAFAGHRGCPGAQKPELSPSGHPRRARGSGQDPAGRRAGQP